jgi:diketogulonate reductase-like aldo/keto reductase
MEDPTVVKIAEKVGKSPAQVLIRYCLQKGWVPLPKSEKEERVKQNADVFGFSISEDDMASLDGLEDQQGPRHG